MVSIHHERGELAAAITPVSSLSEAAAAIAVIVLAILGLVGVVPDILMAIATIVVGCGILLLGAQSAAEYAQLVGAAPVAAGGGQGATGGMTLDFLAGGTGIVLGILALFSHVTELVPAALIVFGGTLLLMGGAMARRRVGATSAVETVAADAFAEEMSLVAGGAQLLIGIAVIVLGILAFIPIHAAILTLVGFLAVGAGLLAMSVGHGGVWSLLRD